MARKTPVRRPKLINAPPSTNGHAPKTNGVPGGPRMLTANEKEWERYENLVTNLTTLRRDFLANLLDPRRNVDRECGYPEAVTDPWVYHKLYQREPVARRVVQIWPKETWQVQPLIYEDEDPEVVTPFEKAWDDLARQLRGGSMYQDEAGNPVWEYLLRADILSGIGQFGVILMGIDDGLRLDQPAEGVTDGREDPEKPKEDNPSNQSITVSKPDDPTKMANSPWGSFQDTLYSQSSLAPPRSKNTSDGLDLDLTEASPNDPTDESSPIRPDTEREKNDPSVDPLPPEGDDAKGPARKLLFLRVFGENLTQISRWNSDPTSPRFGMPEMYRITLSDPSKQSTGIGQPSTTVDVHWTRVIHVADNLDSSETLGTPRMQPVLNRLIDLAKISGAAGEGYWKQAFATLVLESNPQLAGDVDVDRDDIRNQLENLDGGLQKSLVLLGLQAKTLPPSVTDPTPFVEQVIAQICIALECPVRVFKGSERGELASSQDDAAWNDRLKARQMYYVTPRVIIPFIDRLIAMGVLPKPKSGKKKPGELTSAKGELDAQGKPASGAPGEGGDAPPGEEGGAGEDGGPEGDKPSFPPIKKPGGGGFGGKPKFNANPYYVPTYNAFCPTGEGGGQDNSCGPNEDGGGSASPTHTLKNDVEAWTSGENPERVTIKAGTKVSAKQRGMFAKGRKGDNAKFTVTDENGNSTTVSGKDLNRILTNAILFGKKPVAQETDAKDPDDDDDVPATPDDTDPFGDDVDPDAPDTLGDASAKLKSAQKSTPGYSVEWPDIDSMTDLERAQVFKTRVEAWSAYTAGGVDQVIPPEYAMTHLDQFSDEEALAILAEGIKRQEETLAREAALMEEQGFTPDPANPGAMIDPEQQEAENEIELAKAKNPAGVQQSGPPSPFGAKSGAGGPPGAKKPPPFAKNEATENAFCPTGEGGGQDNSCSSSGGGISDSIDTHLNEASYEHFEKATNKVQHTQTALQNVAKSLGLKTTVQIVSDAQFNEFVKEGAKLVGVNPTLIRAVYKPNADTAHFRESTITKIQSMDDHRKFLQTAYHELGHAYDAKVLGRKADYGHTKATTSMDAYSNSKAEDFADAFGSRLILAQKKSSGKGKVPNSMKGKSTKQIIEETKDV